MINRIIVTDLYSAEHDKNGFGGAIISITDTYAPDAKLDQSWTKVLTLKFDDIDPEWWAKIGAHIDPKKVFGPEHAKQIFSFVNQVNIMPIAKLVVHCNMGVSRSGAVGEFLANKFGFKLTSKHDLVPNPHIVKVLTQEWECSPFKKAMFPCVVEGLIFDRQIHER